MCVVTDRQMFDRFVSIMGCRSFVNHPSGGYYCVGLDENERMMITVGGFVGDLNGEWIMDGETFHAMTSSRTLLMFHIGILQNLG